MFRVLEGGRENLEISDYSLCQTTLDDVFIHFASMQSEDVELSGREGEKKGRKITRHRLPLSDVMAGVSYVECVKIGCDVVQFFAGCEIFCSEGLCPHTVIQVAAVIFMFMIMISCTSHSVS